jgi:predicted enzyme related to lactoylglutathione lyase
MTIVLNHTIVPARDKEASAQFFADIFGLKVEPDVGHGSCCTRKSCVNFGLC